MAPSLPEGFRSLFFPNFLQLLPLGHPLAHEVGQKPKHQCRVLQVKISAKFFVDFEEFGVGELTSLVELQFADYVGFQETRDAVKRRLILNLAGNVEYLTYLSVERLAHVFIQVVEQLFCPCTSDRTSARR